MRSEQDDDDDEKMNGDEMVECVLVLIVDFLNS